MAHIITNIAAKDLPVLLESEDIDDAEFIQLPARQALLPVPNPTKSFWTHGAPDCNPLAREGSEGPLTEEADVVIIGSGITGVSTAYHLSNLIRDLPPEVTSSFQKKGGFKVVILEARDFCSGATGRNGGHLTPGLYPRMYELSQRYGPAEAAKNLALERHTVSELLKIIEGNGWEKEVDLVAGGHIQLILTDRELHDVSRDIEAAKVAGVEGLDNMRWLTKEEVDKEYGTPHPAVHIPGHNLWPLRLMTKLFRLVQGQNQSNATTPSFPWSLLPSSFTNAASPAFHLNLHTHTTVLSVKAASEVGEASAGRQWEVETSRGLIKANYVVHATNGFASHLLPHLAGPENGIVPTRGQVIAINAAVPYPRLWSGGLPGWGGNQGYEYWFPRPPASGDSDERPLIIIGGGRETATPKFEYNISDDSVINPTVSKTLRSFLPAAFVGQFDENTEPKMEWSGIMGFTKTHDPMVGIARSDYSGQYIAAGYSGHGMPRAFACAEAVAQMIYADLCGKKWTPPNWLPRWYLTPGTLPEEEEKATMGVIS